MPSTYAGIMECKFSRILSLLPAIQGLPPTPRDLNPCRAFVKRRGREKIRGPLFRTWGLIMLKAEYIRKTLIVSDNKHLSVRMTVAASSQTRKTSPNQLPVAEGATLAGLLGRSQGSQVNRDKINPSLPIHNVAHLHPGSALQ